jgi:hypothetical protein
VHQVVERERLERRGEVEARPDLDLEDGDHEPAEHPVKDRHEREDREHRGQRDDPRQDELADG